MRTVLLLLVFGTSLSANDWPHWRGPSATGVAAPSPLPATWSAKENIAWQMPLEGAGVSSSIYLSRGYRSSPYMAIRLGGSGDITSSHVTWRVPTGGPYVSSLVLYQGVIYMGGENGILSAVDAANGQRLWQERVGGVFTASPIAGDGKIYFVSESGETVVLKAGRTFEIVSRNKLEGHFVASPAAAAGRVYLRADDRIFAVGRQR